MPLRVQLAVQGGGAKLCGLLAALEAVQRLEAEGLLTVTRLAGTSAGSIAAALYAAGIDLGTIRQRIKDNQKRLVRFVPHLRKTDYGKILLGRTVADLEPIRRILADVFDERGLIRFGDLKKPLYVIATDIHNAKTQVYGGFGHGMTKSEDLIVDALVNSCAIPFYFRGPSDSNSGIVDGGICENLPVDVLQQFEAESGIVVGITFVPTTAGASAKGIVGFCRSLLDAAMSHSVRRAQLALGSDRLLPLKLNIDTFDFERALTDGMGDKYDLTMAQADTFFRGLAAKEAQLTAPTTVVESGVGPEESATTLQRVADLYKAQHLHVKMAYVEARMVVRVGALRQTEGAGVRPDFLSYRVRFAAAKEPLACARVGLAAQGGTMFRGTFRKAVYDRDGRSLQTIDLVAQDKDIPDERGYLLFFDPVIQPGDSAAPFTLDYTHQVVGLMAPLANSGVDVLAFENSRAEGLTSRVILTALIPKSHPDIGIRASPRTTGKVVGREMTDQDLNGLQLAIEPDHYPVGWIGENLEPNTLFEAEIFDPHFRGAPKA